ncbi:MAG TPA: Hsp70 family protein [Actinocatenispora sp.]
MAESLVLSIDFGSSNTVAVLREATGRSRVLLFDGSPLLPSAVFAADGGLAVGRDAAHMARNEPARFEPYPKRRIDDGEVLLGRRVVPVVDLVAAVLRRVADEARRVAGALPPVVLTHPVAWGQMRRGVLAEAARRAGLTVAGLVAEPIAAASYFTAVLGSRLPVGRALAVFDFGGGTLDVAVVRRGGDGLVVVATGGLDGVGGVDLDAAVIVHIGQSIGAAAPAVWQRLAAPPDESALRDRAAVWQDARTAKEMLSRSPSAAVHVPGAPAGTHVTRAEFEALAAPLVGRTVAETVATLRRAGLTPTDLAGVFLVGGSSRIPLVAQQLHRALGIAPIVLEQPETAVAEGALHSPAAPRISPRLARALDDLDPAIRYETEPAPTTPRRRRRWAPLIAGVSFLAAAGLVLGILRPWQHDAADHVGDPTAGSGAGMHTASPTPTDSPALAPSPTPSDPCPTIAQAKDAISRDKYVASGMDFSVHDDPKCKKGYAYVVMSAQQGGVAIDNASVVMKFANGRWDDIVLGTDICSPEDGARPAWAKGVPDDVVEMAGCDLADYRN